LSFGIFLFSTVTFMQWFWSSLLLDVNNFGITVMIHHFNSNSPLLLIAVSTRTTTSIRCCIKWTLTNLINSCLSLLKYFWIILNWTNLIAMGIIRLIVWHFAWLHKLTYIMIIHWLIKFGVIIQFLIFKLWTCLLKRITSKTSCSNCSGYIWFFLKWVLMMLVTSVCILIEIHFPSIIKFNIFILS
jgi:hypothetical protein